MQMQTSLKNKQTKKNCILLFYFPSLPSGPVSSLVSRQANHLSPITSLRRIKCLQLTFLNHILCVVRVLIHLYLVGKLLYFLNCRLPRRMKFSMATAEQNWFNLLVVVRNRNRDSSRHATSFVLPTRLSRVFDLHGPIFPTSDMKRK